MAFMFQLKGVLQIMQSQCGVTTAAWSSGWAPPGAPSAQSDNAYLVFIVIILAHVHYTIK